MNPDEFCVIRTEKGAYYGAMLYIGDTRQECYRVAKEFKSEGVACKVLSYEQLEELEAIHAKMYENWHP